jgi:6-phospho-3-hexuloisomerase
MVSIQSDRSDAESDKERALHSSLNQTIELILEENRQVLSKINYAAIAQLTLAIAQSKRIFVAGEGRSGLVIRMVAMRLMHLGYQVYVVGETTTPSIIEGDLFVDCSGSGSTEMVTTLARKAKEIGAEIVTVTTHEDSPLGKMADIVIKLEAAAKQDQSHQHSQQFAGSLFEQSTLLLFDAVFQVLSQNMHENTETLWARHTNLE